MSTGTESGSPALNLEKCSVVLLDVAGTTTSLNFVKETLFPHVTKQAEEFLKAQWEDETVKEAVKLLKDSELDVAGATAAVKELTEQNSNNKGLKTIQGLIYKKGYEDGDLKAHIFSDVPTSLEAWAKSRKVVIYSTGSIESQQLLFSHTAEGDVSPHITRYFDQSIGDKTESESYEKIAKELEVKTEEIIFVTDSSKEAEAAKSAGVVSVLVKREGNEEIPEEAAKAFPTVSSFKEIVFENSAKRKNEDETVPAEEQPPSKLAKTDAAEDKPAGSNVPVDETPHPEEKMEVDTHIQDKADAKEEKPKDKPSEPIINTDKTEMDSSDKKTEKTSPTEQTEPEKVVEEKEETPMETAVDTVVAEKTEVDEKVDKPEETEDKKEETVTLKEHPKGEKTDAAAEEVVGKAIEETHNSDNTQQMEVEDNSEPSSNKDSNNDATAVEVKESVETVKVEVQVESKETNEVDTKKDEIKETLESATNKTSEVEMKEDSGVSGKVEENINEMKGETMNQKKEEETKERVEENKIETTPEQTEEVVSTNGDEKEKSSNPKEESVEEIKCVEDSTKVEGESNGTGESVETAESSSAKCEQQVKKEKAESSKACPQEESVEPSSSVAEMKSETSKDEKENKSELANGVENGGKTENTEVVNGDADEKQNGESNTEESDSKVEDIKVKKIEETPDSTPAVSVEV